MRLTKLIRREPPPTGNWSPLVRLLAAAGGGALAAYAQVERGLARLLRRLTRGRAPGEQR